MDSIKRSQGLTIVIKLGTSSIVDEKTNDLSLSTLSMIVETVARLRHANHRVILVSSGAVGVGGWRMEIDRTLKHHSNSKALAAVGQCQLMSVWHGLFGHLEIPVAQVLLSGNNIAYPTGCANIQTTFSRLLDMNVIPIINENDTLVDEDNKIGDNDTLSAIISALVKADYLFLMTDVDCLYLQNPRHCPDAEPIEIVPDISALVADVSTCGSSLGTGGMGTKISAARLATAAGVTTIITKSAKPSNVIRLVRYLEGGRGGQATVVPLHTRFLPSAARSDLPWNHWQSQKGFRFVDEERTSSSESGSIC